jgi:hypothetical protein
MILPLLTDHYSLGTSRNEFTEAQKNACSIDAMLNGGECEAIRVRLRP